MGIESMFYKTIKAGYEELNINNILNWETLEVFPLRIRTRLGCPLSSLLFKIVQGILARNVRQEKEIEEI